MYRRKCSGDAGGSVSDADADFDPDADDGSIVYGYREPWHFYGRRAEWDCHVDS